MWSLVLLLVSASLDKHMFDEFVGIGLGLKSKQ